MLSKNPEAAEGIPPVEITMGYDNRSGFGDDEEEEEERFVEYSVRILDGPLEGQTETFYVKVVGD